MNVDVAIILTRRDAFTRIPDLLPGRDANPLTISGRRMLSKQRLQRYEGSESDLARR